MSINILWYKTKSPDLVSLYSEIVYGALEDMTSVHSIEGYNINRSRYSDDTVLIVDNEMNVYNKC